MEDREIVALYHLRDEKAVTETKNKYEQYLLKIAYNILADFQDSEESVNDTYLRAWNSMPPHRPDVLSAFLAKITRRSSIDIFRKKHSGKRINSEYVLSLDELTECMPSGNDPEKESEAADITSVINSYLHSLPEEQRNIFIMRYFYFDSVNAIASFLGISESRVKTTLFRLRNGLKTRLEKEELL